MLCVFDTEGTTVTDYRGTYGVLYAWDLLELLVDPEQVFPETVRDCTRHHEGRDCTTLYTKLWELVEQGRETGEPVRIGVHNLTYDFGYLRHFFTHVTDRGYQADICARNSTHLITASLKYGKQLCMVLFDTVALFRTSLRTLGESLGFRKLELDYTRACAPDTTLDAASLDYNRRDTELLMTVFCRNYMTLPYIEPDSPGQKVITKTGMVRALDRSSEYIGMAPYGRRTVYEDDRMTVSKHQFADADALTLWGSYTDTRGCRKAGCYAGGVNVSNMNTAGTIQRNVVCYDLKSAYPAIMMTYRIPTDPEDLEDPAMMSPMFADPDAPLPDPTSVALCEGGFYVADVEFTSLTMRQSWRSAVGDSTITVAMARQHGGDNLAYEDGYLVAASSITLTLTPPVYNELRMQYTWERAICVRATLYNSRSRPTPYQCLTVLHHYAEKTAAKTLSKHATPDAVNEAYTRGYVTYDERDKLLAGGASKDWLHRFVMSHKENLNGLYGISVMNPVRESYYLDDNGYIGTHPSEGFEEYKKLRRNRKMWREAGVLVSLFNRYKISYAANLVVQAGGSVLYIDTDSIKSCGLTKPTLDGLFSPMHTAIESAIRDMVGYTASKVGSVMPTLDDSFYELGKFDYEGTYARFFSPGHKKYAYDEGQGWEYKCAGYAVKVVEGFGRAVTEAGYDDIAPLLALGYDVRYDSSTKIATALSGIPQTWIESSFEALDVSDGDAVHAWRGETCPGYAVCDVGKIMNNTEGNTLNQQRYAAASRNNPALRDIARIDVAMRDGNYVWGKRGLVRMDFKGFNETGGTENAIF